MVPVWCGRASVSISVQYMDIHKEVHQRHISGLLTLVLWIGLANGFSESEGLWSCWGALHWPVPSLLALSPRVAPEGWSPASQPQRPVVGHSRGLPAQDALRQPAAPLQACSCAGRDTGALAGSFSSHLLFVMALERLSSLRGGGFWFPRVAQQ